MVAVSPGFAAVVSRMTTPSGLVDDSDAEVMVRGLTGCESSPVTGFFWTGTCVAICVSVACPATSWPKTV